MSSDADTQALFDALARVAAHALMLRQVRVREWGTHEETAIQWALGNLDESLDVLEMASPSMHATLSSQQAAVLNNFRRDLGLPPD